MPAPDRANDRNAIVLAGLRIAVGLLFLIFAQYKVFGTQFTLHGGFESWIKLFLAGNAYPFMVPVLRNFVLVHGTAIAFFVAYGELAIGHRKTRKLRTLFCEGFWKAFTPPGGRSR